MAPSGVVEDDNRRCTATRVRDGVRQRCKRAASIGLDVCRSHGAQLPRNAAKSETAKLVGALRKLVEPIAADDWEANPANALLMDVRRCIAAIRYLDEKIEFMSEEALTYGLAFKESTSGIVDNKWQESTTRRYERGMNTIVVQRMEERKHLLALTKVWIGAKLDVARIEIEQNTVLALNSVIVNVLRSLGKDVNDPEVRRVVRDQLLSLPGAKLDGNTIDG